MGHPVQTSWNNRCNVIMPLSDRLHLVQKKGEDEKVEAGAPVRPAGEEIRVEMIICDIAVLRPMLLMHLLTRPNFVA